jgi:hypothetical protein
VYSLLVSQVADEEAFDQIVLDRNRFLEYTADAIKMQLSTLTADAVDHIKSYPCLLIAEGKGAEIARLVRIRELRVKARELIVTVEVISTRAELTNDDLWRMRSRLDIADFEFSRNHWSVKDVELVDAMRSAGVELGVSDGSELVSGTLPAPERSQLLAAGKAIGELGHTDITELLLHVGIDDLKAGPELGSRRDRAQAIIAYALANPGAATADNQLLSAYLVRAAKARQSLPEVPRVAWAVTPAQKSSPVAVRGEAPKLAPLKPVKRDGRQPDRVFVVHGRNETARNAVVAFLSAQGLTPVVLHDQPNMGRHLLTKFIEEADLTTFAVVLMTDDDVGGQSDAELRPRARQNVILELGYFLSHLGQRNVCALKSPGLETPSDFDGIVYISMGLDQSWQQELYRELVAAGLLQ